MVTSFKLARLTIFLVLLSACGKNDGLPIGSGNSCSTCKIFLSVGFFNGNLGGFSGADDKCNAEAAAGGDRYKALLGGRSDWPLQPNTIYINEDGETIGTTNASARFTFPLTSTISDTGNTAWTGLATDWSLSPNNCLGWTSLAPGDSGTFGGSASTTSAALVSGFSNCPGSFRHLYCVQQ